MEYVFKALAILDHILWSYIALAFILFMGIYFTIKSRFYQLKVLLKTKSHFQSLFGEADKTKTGVHPLKLYFASLGGMVGIGNLVVVIATVQIGGPGSLLWLWIAAFLGMIVKYSEVYLGLTYRVSTEYGYDGGPMYYLKVAFGSKIMPIIFCLLFCVYGVEVSQFLIMTDTFAKTFDIERMIIVLILLSLVMLSAIGGVKRLANICTILLPPFVLVYVALGGYIIWIHSAKLPSLFMEVLVSACTGNAATGGLIGSTILLAAHYGVSRAVYSGDIGIGYDATVLSESQTTHPEKQARMTIFALLVDALLCTISILIVLLTGVLDYEGALLSDYVMLALSTIMPFADIFILFLFFVSGFTTIVGYLVVGRKCSNFINARYGRTIYMMYASIAFVVFSFYEQSTVILMMSVSGGLLMICNLSGVFKLRHHVKFL